ncbi:MAG: DUF2169 domain-containing protein [Candidatus Rokubacteria bacterium]|nr:DUF2169 domain-containing protein [Candidatus Rokubacteria bacterium]
MWTLTEDLPFVAERAWVRDRNGAEVWLVVVRGSFDIHPDGSTRPSPDQSPVALAPVYRGDPLRSSLIYDSDLVHTKTATDVLLNGHAYAPGFRPTTHVDVTMSVGPIRKTLRVVGDRLFRGTIQIVGTPQPFLKLPITYERTWGGVDPAAKPSSALAFDPRNPVGVGFAKHQSHLAGTPAPNVESIDSSKRRSPAGFGPIAPHWATRLQFAGTYDEQWEKHRLPLLPDDFDDRFYQCAPDDQQVAGFIKGGELVELTNLTPGGSLRFRLPRVRLGFETVFGDGEPTLHRADLHTVILEPDTPRVIMVWHTSLPCHHRGHKLVGTEITIKRPLHVSDEDRTSGMWMGEMEP